MGNLYIVGGGPGGPGCMTRRGQEILESAPAVFAFSRQLELAGPKAQVFGPSLEQGIADLSAALERGDAALVLTGDPCLFSLTRRLKDCFGPKIAEIVPAPGALQAFFATIGETWEEARILSGHGRPLSEAALALTVQEEKLTVLYCDSTHDLAWACETLCRAGLGSVDVCAGEELTLPEQKILRGSAQELQGAAMGGNALVRFRNGSPRRWRPMTGLPDSAFRRGSVPMTKQVIRSQVLALLELERDSLSWDVGAGTGSVSVEMALSSPLGQVYALEQDPRGLELIEANAQALGAANVIALAGHAPEALKDLPAPSRVFVGGSGGALEEILEEVARRGPGIRVVVTAVTLETAMEAGRILEGPRFQDAQAFQLAVTRVRKAGRSHLLMAENPVTLWSAWTASADQSGTGEAINDTLNEEKEEKKEVQGR